MHHSSDEYRAALIPTSNLVLTKVRVIGGSEHKNPVGAWVTYRKSSRICKGQSQSYVEVSDGGAASSR